ncbi:E3 ubiquitin ligase, partial [Brachionus plicatilis]
GGTEDEPAATIYRTCFGPSELKLWKNCIKKYAETNIGEMKYEFPCFGIECDSKFSQKTLEMVLEKNIFEKLCKKLCTKAVQEANLENLESCPFCEYVAIVESSEEKIFYCMNPECMKDSCRKCKEPNHLPLKCEELENKTEVDMRTWIENKMNEAMIRVCYKCNKRFYKEEGCNMMHCQCGAQMCYICREPITGYGHFGSGNKCSQFNDTNQVHMNEMKEAYEKACKEYYEKYPHKVGMQLKFDPKIFLDQFETDKNAKKKNLIPNTNQYLARLNQGRQFIDKMSKRISHLEI